MSGAPKTTTSEEDFLTGLRALQPDRAAERRQTREADVAAALEQQRPLLDEAEAIAADLDKLPGEFDGLIAKVTPLDYDVLRKVLPPCAKPEHPYEYTAGRLALALRCVAEIAPIVRTAEHQASLLRAAASRLRAAIEAAPYEANQNAGALQLMVKTLRDTPTSVRVEGNTARKLLQRIHDDVGDLAQYLPAPAPTPAPLTPPAPTVGEYARLREAEDLMPLPDDMRPTQAETAFDVFTYHELKPEPPREGKKYATRTVTYDEGA